jgi:hypothetical protein
MSTRALMLLWIAAMAVPTWGQSSSHFALTPEQVARALTAAGIVTVAQQVSLPARVVAAEPAPALDILSIEPPLRKAQLTAHSPSRVRLACHQSGECLPFYANVNWSKVDGQPAPSSIIVPLAGNATNITMRAGTHATLVMDDQRSHIQVAVISLENGMAGHRIRVATPDHKQFYFGEVVNANLLRGSF